MGYTPGKIWLKKKIGTPEGNRERETNPGREELRRRISSTVTERLRGLRCVPTGHKRGKNIKIKFPEEESKSRRASQ